jgi:ABC-2 type transport system permease protein
MVVADRELRDLWLAGRGLPLLLAYTVLLSVTSYLVAANQALNFLEQREAVGLTLQVAVAVGALLVLLGAADAVSGERERGTLESLLLSPAPRRSLVIGKAVAALSLWAAAWIVSLPYVWYLGRGVGVVGVAVAGSLVVGSLLALFLAGYGLFISIIVSSNRLSLSVSLFALLALYAPTQMPTAVQLSWIGELLLRLDPFTAGLRYLGRLVINGRGPGQDVGWLIGPLVAAVVAAAVAVTVAGRFSLQGGDRA